MLPHTVVHTHKFGRRTHKSDCDDQGHDVGRPVMQVIELIPCRVLWFGLAILLSRRCVAFALASADAPSLGVAFRRAVVLVLVRRIA